MNNKVIYTLYHLFAERGFSALRFNFRGWAAARASSTAARGN
jgi:Predicted hydrolase of the alpha/beta superfamily